MNNFLDKFSKNRRHQQSLDDFMKQLKKINLKSQRHLSPKPLLFMYSKPQHTQYSHTHNTNHTLDKSRSLSNRRSNSKKSTKTKKTKKKVSLILNVSNEDIKSSSNKRGNPGDLIQTYSQRIRKVQRYLHKKNSIGEYLCQKFQEMLNNIVQNMIQELNNKMMQLERVVETRVQRQMLRTFQIKQKKSNKYMQKLQTKIQQLVEKQYYNNQLIYQLRKGWEQMGIPCIDIDLLYGQIFSVQGVGGNGYSNSEMQNQDPNLSGLQQPQNYLNNQDQQKEQNISEPEIKIQDSQEEQQQGNDNITDRPSASKKLIGGQKNRIIGQLPKKERIHDGKKPNVMMLRNQQYLKAEQKHQQSSSEQSRMQFRIRQKLPDIVDQKKELQKASIHQRKQKTGQQYIRNYKQKTNKKVQQQINLESQGRAYQKEVNKQKKYPQMSKFNFS